MSSKCFLAYDQLWIQQASTYKRSCTLPWLHLKHLNMKGTDFVFSGHAALGNALTHSALRGYGSIAWLLLLSKKVIDSFCT